MKYCITLVDHGKWVSAGRSNSFFFTEESKEKVVSFVKSEIECMDDKPYAIAFFSQLVEDCEEIGWIKNLRSLGFSFDYEEEVIIDDGNYQLFLRKGGINGKIIRAS